MAYHDELLQHAFELVQKQKPTQADLRRAVSSAYYAVFHLLISETVGHWRWDDSRDALARMFEHRIMTKASLRVLDAKALPFIGVDPGVVHSLRVVAKAFTTLQENRHIADYDGSVRWTAAEALEEVRRAEKAFVTWQSIRNEKIAQDYLVSLLIKPRN